MKMQLSPCRLNFPDKLLFCYHYLQPQVFRKARDTNINVLGVRERESDTNSSNNNEIMKVYISNNRQVLIAKVQSWWWWKYVWYLLRTLPFSPNILQLCFWRYVRRCRRTRARTSPRICCWKYQKYSKIFPPPRCPASSQYSIFILELWHVQMARV